MKVYPFIAAEKAAAGNVARACSVLSVSRSAYYEWSKNTRPARTREDDQLAGLVERIYRESRGTYGAPRVHQKLRQDGVHTSRKRVARLMASQGLAGRFKRRSRRTTVADGSRTGADLLGRRFGPGQRRPDEAWVSDITYIRTWEGLGLPRRHNRPRQPEGGGLRRGPPPAHHPRPRGDEDGPPEPPARSRAHLSL